MKKFAYALINFLLQFKSFRKAVNILNWEKTAYTEALVSKQISPDSRVLGGPFKGMQYAELKANGSPLLPKILGSYEDELQDVFTKIIAKNYKTVIDVGCAEGYYAVGLAIRLTEAQVFAFDTDPLARERCAKLATINNVANRVQLNGLCDSNTLRNFEFNYPSFIICDCEGYEKQLFTTDNLPALKQVDILIELHHQEVPDIFDYITGLFKESHDMIFVKSHAKHVVNYPVLKNIDKAYYKDSLIIDRDDLMTWVFLEAKNK